MTWCLRAARPEIEVSDGAFRARGGAELREEMAAAAEEHRPDLLFVHRDAERATLDVRRAEIPAGPGLVVRVVPVRMTEAWLLLDEQAIRQASDNPRGRNPLGLPAAAQVERHPNPKGLLQAALLAASGRGGPRRRRRFERDSAELVHRVAAWTFDFSPLRALTAFRAFESDLADALGAWERGAH